LRAAFLADEHCLGFHFVGELSASSFQLPASSFRLPASGFQLPPSGFQLPASSYQLSVSASGCVELAAGSW
jgi:hypothetical protein